MRKPSTIKRLVCGLALVFSATALITAFTPLSNILARPLIVEPSVKKADIIVVLGGGAYGNGVLKKASSERLLQGLLLYKEGFAGRIAFSGGSISNTMEKAARTISGTEDPSRINVVESEIMRDISLKLGIPRSALYVDAASTHTYSNIVNVKDLMRSEAFKSCLLVTSPTHMLRALKVSQKLGLDCSPAPVEDYTPYRKISADRIGLMYEVLWEYAGLVVYKARGYI